MYKNLNDLKSDLQNFITFHDPHITVHKPELAPEHIDKLIFTAVFTSDETLKAKAQKIIHLIAKQTGVLSTSIRPLYSAFAKNEVGGFTVPAINIRMLTYDLARAIFRIAKQKNAAAFIIEIAPTESQYTGQPPEEFSTVILAAAIKEQYSNPVFIQGDHCQFSPKRWAQDKDTELKRLKDWVSRLIDSGFRNIDIDGSTLVDLSKPSLHAQQKENAFVTAEMTKFIREKEKELQGKIAGKLESLKAIKLEKELSNSPTLQLSNSIIAIGGEIGHIGDKNSTVDDFEAFMQQYLNQIDRGSGISKVSAQTGTSHGGVINTDGTVQKMAVDFSVIKSIGETARKKYSIAGAVQHGASTLPLESFHEFTEAKAVEIHLSTGFQNIIFDTMPKGLRDQMYDWLKKECKAEWKEGWTEEQFIYKTRKKVWGSFKKQVWELSEKEKKPIIEALEEYIGTIFEQLKIGNTAEEVKKYIK